MKVCHRVLKRIESSPLICYISMAYGDGASQPAKDLVQSRSADCGHESSLDGRAREQSAAVSHVSQSRRAVSLLQCPISSTLIQYRLVSSRDQLVNIYAPYLYRDKCEFFAILILSQRTDVALVGTRPSLPMAS